MVILICLDRLHSSVSAPANRILNEVPIWMRHLVKKAWAGQSLSNLLSWSSNFTQSHFINEIQIQNWLDL